MINTICIHIVSLESAIYLHISGRARGLEVFAKPPAFEDEFIHANFGRKNNAKDF